MPGFPWRAQWGPSHQGWQGRSRGADQRPAPPGGRSFSAPRASRPAPVALVFGAPRPGRSAPRAPRRPCQPCKPPRGAGARQLGRAGAGIRPPLAPPPPPPPSHGPAPPRGPAVRLPNASSSWSSCGDGIQGWVPAASRVAEANMSVLDSSASASCSATCSARKRSAVVEACRKFFSIIHYRRATSCPP